MRLFISWSGKRSHDMANAINDWLDYVAPAAEPFLSSEIRKGEQWPTKLREELKTTQFAIVCVTSENQAEPWINFETGAASHRLESALVCPLLLDLTGSNVIWPLAMFQTTLCTEADLFRLARDINAKVERPLAEEKLKKAFNIAYAPLAKAIAALKKGGADLAKPPARKSDDLISETLELVREQNQLLGQIAQQTAPPTFTVGENIRLVSPAPYKPGVGLVGGTFGSNDLSGQLWQSALSPSLGLDILGRKGKLVPLEHRSRKPKKRSGRKKTHRGSVGVSRG